MEIKQISKQDASAVMSSGFFKAIETCSYVVYRVYNGELQQAIILDKEKDNYLCVSFSVSETKSYLNLIAFLI